ncbi:Hypothetical predicted protein, partial [Pelobates cultripes]
MKQRISLCVDGGRKKPKKGRHWLLWTEPSTSDFDIKEDAFDSQGEGAATV